MVYKYIKVAFVWNSSRVIIIQHLYCCVVCNIDTDKFIWEILDNLAIIFSAPTTRRSPKSSQTVRPPNFPSESVTTNAKIFFSEPKSLTENQLCQRALILNQEGKNCRQETLSFAESAQSMERMCTEEINVNVALVLTILNVNFCFSFIKI